MAENAEIGVPQIAWGIYPGIAGASTQLRTLHKEAAWSVLTGRRMSAQRAMDSGVVNMVVPGDRLMDEAKSLAAHISRFEPNALDWSKKALDQVPTLMKDQAVALEYGYGVNNIIRDQVAKSRAQAAES